MNRYLHKLKQNLEDYNSCIIVLTSKKKRSERLDHFFDANIYQDIIKDYQEKVSSIKQKIKRLENESVV